MREVQEGLPLAEDASALLKDVLANATSRAANRDNQRPRPGFSPIFISYNITSFRKSQALEEFLLLLNDGSSTLRHPWYRTGIEGMCAERLTSFQGIVQSCQNYIRDLDSVLSEKQLTIKPAIYEPIKDFIREYTLFTQANVEKHSFIKKIVAYFERFQEILNHFLEHNKLSCTRQELSDLVFNVQQNVSLASRNIKIPKPSDLTKLHTCLATAHEIMMIQNEIDISTPSTLHSVEVVLLEARRLMLIRPDISIIKAYLKMNRDLIRIQIRLLEYLVISSTTIDLWPVLNRDLERVQEKVKPFPAQVLLKQKKHDIDDCNDVFAEELVPLVGIVYESERINDNFMKQECNLSDTLASLARLQDTVEYKQHALIRFFILANIINCFCTKYSSETVMSPINLTIMQQDIETQIGFMENFAKNLRAVKPVWNEKVFKFFNNFIFIKNNLHKVISTTELIFLHCDVLYRNAHIVGPQFKNQVIEMQINLLRIQHIMLDFAKKECVDEYVRTFYFKNKDGEGFIYYDAIVRNKELAEKGDRQNIIHGIPLEGLLKYNEMRRLKLEALLLEPQAKQSQPQDTDCFPAISSEELEECLAKWEKEAAKIKEREKDLEEEQHKAKIKQKQNLQKRADKRARKAKANTKSREESKGEKLYMVTAPKPAPKQASELLAIKLDQLTLQLNPEQFCAEIVTQVINELYQLIVASLNKELVFNALSAIGDSYSMVAGHQLNHAKKHPEAVIVDLKLALNYYSRAELALRELIDISIEQHSHYYTWLHHSINLQQQLLDQYVLKFTRKHNELLQSREAHKQANPELWNNNHLNPNWRESKKAVQTRNLGNALDAAMALKNECIDFSLRLAKKVHSATGHQAYSFQYRLDHNRKRPLPKQQLRYALEAHDVQQPEPENETAMMLTFDQAAPSENMPLVPLSSSSIFAFNQNSTISTWAFASNSAEQLMPPFAPQRQAPHSSSSAITPCVQPNSESWVTQLVGLPDRTWQIMTTSNEICR